MSSNGSNVRSVFITMATKYRLLIILVLVVIITGISASFYIARLDRDRDIANERIKLLADISTIRARLEGLISSTFNLTLGLVHYVELEGNISRKLFEGISIQAVKDSKYISHIAIAPDNIVRWVYPLAGNEEAIGLSYLENQEQQSSVLRMMDEMEPILAGPVNLVQGGVALINRAPIFYSSDSTKNNYWGLVSIVANLDEFLEDSGVSTSALYNLAIRGGDALGMRGGMVWGDPDVFSSDPVIQYVSVPGGYWVLGAIPQQGWHENAVYNSAILFIGFGITFLLTTLILVLLYSNYRIDVKNSLLASEVAVRESAEKALRISEEKFRGLVEQMNDVVMRLTTSGIIVYCSPVITKVAEFDPEELNGIFVGDLTNDFNEVKRIVAGFNSAISKEEAETISFSFKKKSGQTITAEIVFRLVQYEGISESVHCLLRDVTIQKALETELINSMEEAEAANRLKTAFLANMSHEIRTPMNSILGFSDLLLMENNSKETSQEFLSIINRSTKRLLNVINDIIDISIIESGQLKINIGLVDLKSLFRGIYDLHHITASDKGIELKGPGETAIICAGFRSDESRIYQILSNLVSNAIKFTRSGYVEFGCSPGKDGIFLFVKDTGIGISKEDQKIIFERFRQAEQHSKSVYGGTGLGLAISRSLAEMMGGTITVESEEGEGTTFTLFLPSMDG